jgi:hypothetical protein
MSAAARSSKYLSATSRKKRARLDFEKSATLLIEKNNVATAGIFCQR